MNERKNHGVIARPTKRILVTGGCGFIGSHLIDALLQNPNNEVICLDNCFSGIKKNIAHHLANPNFEFIRHDVTVPTLLDIDEIYHLASPASPVFYQHDGVATIKTNVLGTMNMLELATKCRARILLASTSEIYGEPLKHPQTEDYWGNVNPIGVRSCYDEGKRMGETLMYQYHRQYGVSIRVARIFNTYGPRMLEYDGRVVSNFIRQALKGDPLTIYGDGSQTRSFCYVTDTVKALILLMNSSYSQPVNIGNPLECTISELANLVCALFNGSLLLTQLPLPSDDPTRRCPNIAVAARELDWWPEVRIEDGLVTTIEDFQNRI